MEESTTVIRVCTRCKEGKTESSECFAKDARYAGGLKRWCRDCVRVYDRQRRENPENRVKEIERHRKIREAEPQKARDKAKRSYKKHAEKRRAERREYGAAHRAEETAKRLEWARENPLREKNITARKRARKYGVFIGEVDLQRVLDTHGWTCHICLKSIDGFETLTFDHLLALAAGGSHTEGNLKPAHYVCNRAKNRKDLAEMRDLHAGKHPRAG